MHWDVCCRAAPPGPNAFFFEKNAPPSCQFSVIFDLVQSVSKVTTTMFAGYFPQYILHCFLLNLLISCTIAANTTDDGPMGPFWSQTSNFVFRAANIFQTPGQTGSAYQMNTGFHTVATANPNEWYLFHREYFFAPNPSYCPADYAQIVVRTSQDQARSTPRPDSQAGLIIVY
jgi:hypothetical protein